jgi:hypothetical protein
MTVPTSKGVNVIVVPKALRTPMAAPSPTKKETTALTTLPMRPACSQPSLSATDSADGASFSSLIDFREHSQLKSLFGIFHE